MTKVFHYIPQTTSKFICSKGGLHAQQPLNLVCLDPLCRNDPLGCSVCFVNIHKHHRVVSVDKFLDDYARNIKHINQGSTLKKIQKQHSSVKDLIDKLRADINKRLDDFEQSIDEYANELRTKSNMRQFISKSLGITLEPAQIKNSKSNRQFAEILKFILNNSLFDSSKNMIRIADILKQDQERIFALLDKMVNMTENCQDYIKEVMKNLNFSDNTLKEEKITLKSHLDKMKINQNQFDTESYKQKEVVNQTVCSQIQVNKPHWHQSLYMTATGQEYSSQSLGDVKFTFSTKNKHELISVNDQFNVGVSNITALKPQYAFLTPHVNSLPSQVKQWSIKIKNCRNFASQNTMGIGLATLGDLSNSKFEGHYPKKATMVTSQGYVLEGGESRKTNMIFGTGDILYCKYDPFYKLFEISKDNGRKLSLTVDRPEKDELFVCVRLTYASDQVQIL